MYKDTLLLEVVQGQSYSLETRLWMFEKAKTATDYKRCWASFPGYSFATNHLKNLPIIKSQFSFRMASISPVSSQTPLQTGQ